MLVGRMQSRINLPYPKITSDIPISSTLLCAGVNNITSIGPIIKQPTVLVSVHRSLSIPSKSEKIGAISAHYHRRRERTVNAMKSNHPLELNDSRHFRGCLDRLNSALGSMLGKVP